MTTTPALRDHLDELAAFPGTSARVFGSFAEVAGMIDRAHAAGRVVHVTPPRAARNGQVVVDVRLRPQRRSGRRRVVSLVVAAVVVLLVLLAAAGLALQWLIAHLPHVLVAAAIIGALLAAAGRAGVCVGIHCPGCKH